MEDTIRALASEYGAEEISTLSIKLAIERFRDIRSYPSSFTDEDITADMNKNIAKIAMAAVEIDSKFGMEGQTTHTESNISRNFASHIQAYANVVGYVQIL